MPPPRLATADLPRDLLCGPFPVWHAVPLTSHQRLRQQSCVMRSFAAKLPLLCTSDNEKKEKRKTRMRLQPNCSAEIPTRAVDPHKAAFNMNRFCRVQPGNRSSARSGGAAGLSVARRLLSLQQCFISSQIKAQLRPGSCSGSAQPACYLSLFPSRSAETWEAESHRGRVCGCVSSASSRRNVSAEEKQEVPARCQFVHLLAG